MACEVHNEILRFVRPTILSLVARGIVSTSKIVQLSKFSGVSYLERSKLWDEWPETLYCLTTYVDLSQTHTAC